MHTHYVYIVTAHRALLFQWEYYHYNIWFAHPHLYAVSSGGGEGFNKPWRAVERAAGVGRTTPLPIPERVSSLQRVRRISVVVCTVGSVTEVVVSNKAWNWNL